MSQKTTTIGRKNVDVIGRFQLKVNRSPKKFRLTNINAFVPFGKSRESKMQFLTNAGLVDSLIVDKLIVTLNPDRNELDYHNVTTFIQHPDVRLDGFSEDEHRELVRLGLKKSNPKFTLTNIDKVADDAFEAEVKLIQLRSKLFSTDKPLTIEMLVHLCSNFGISYRSEINDADRYRRSLLKKLDSFIQVNSDNRASFVEKIDNMKLTEMIYYINEFEEIGIIKLQSGIYKIQDRPIGADKGKLIQYFESNPTDFQEFKELVINRNQGKIYS